MLFAESIDITVSQGTDQSVIDTLSPAPASPEVDTNTTIKVTFNEALNPIFALKSVSLKKLTKDNNNKGFFGIFQQNNQNSIKGTTRYNSSTYTISFTPDKPLEVGFYEVKFSHLITQMPNIHMRINDIVYRFYVPKVINGFKLPPKPDKDKNDETLLGIDFNYNGIRDDVERWAIMHYSNDPKYPKTKTAMALQYAWASQKILENPIPENKKYLDDAIDCQYYWLDKKTKGLTGFEFGKFSQDHRVFNDPILKDKIYNNRKRIQRYFKFNNTLNGNIFSARKQSIDNCRINIDELGE
jgi:hypothetical protein